MKVDSNRHQYAIHCHSSFCPTFGIDISIANNSITTMDSYSQLSSYYKHPQYEYGTNEAQSFLAGPFSFQLDEIEVNQKNNKN